MRYFKHHAFCSLCNTTGRPLDGHCAHGGSVAYAASGSERTPAVIPDCDEALLLIDLYFDGVHTLLETLAPAVWLARAEQRPAASRFRHTCGSRMRLSAAFTRISSKIL